MKRTFSPDWGEIFRKRPDLESPGYQEALRQVREKTNAIDPMKLRMEQIHKERQSDRNKARRKPQKERN